MPVRSATAIQISGVRTPSMSRVAMDCLGRFTGGVFHMTRGVASLGLPIRLAKRPVDLIDITNSMAAIGRFQRGDEIFFGKVVDGEVFRLHGDAFGSPS